METILIQNFKAIKNTAKREIKVANLTILMGEQATGKSTVAKLVYFFKKLPEEILDEVFNNNMLSEDNFIQLINKRTWQLFRKLFGSSFIEKFNISYTYNNDQNLSIIKTDGYGRMDIKWPDNFNGLEEQILLVANEIKKINIKFDPDSRREYERLGNILSGKIRLFFGIDQHLLYIPASRNMIVLLEDYLIEIISKIEQQNTQSFDPSENSYLILNFVNHVRHLKSMLRNKNFEQLVKEKKNESENNLSHSELLKNIDKILKGQYSNYPDGEVLHIDNENYIFLTNASSGQQEIIRIIQDIFLEILDSRPVFRVYEEPESHLSPIGQLGIIQLIAMLANQNPNNQIIIPTHTPYLLREVSNMMKASTMVKNNPELREEVGEILKPFYWLDMQSVSAYQLTREGEIEDAKDEEHQMVDGELFDRVTNDISDQFDKLLSLQYE